MPLAMHGPVWVAFILIAVNLLAHAFYGAWILDMEGW